MIVQNLLFEVLETPTSFDLKTQEVLQNEFENDLIVKIERRETGVHYGRIKKNDAEYYIDGNVTYSEFYKLEVASNPLTNISINLERDDQYGFFIRLLDENEQPIDADFVNSVIHIWRYYNVEPITYTAQEKSEIYHALSVLNRSNSQKVNEIAERIGFPRPRP